MRRVGKFPVTIKTLVDGELTNTVIKQRVVYVDSNNVHYIDWAACKRRLEAPISGFELTFQIRSLGAR